MLMLETKSMLSKSNVVGVRIGPIFIHYIHVSVMYSYNVFDVHVMLYQVHLF